MKKAKPLGVIFHHVIGTGWVHTHGMDAHGLPELEVRGVPGFLVEPATFLLRHVCEYMAECREVKAGETMEVGPGTRFRFVAATPMPGSEDHYLVERWRLVDVDQGCSCCGSEGPVAGG